MGRGSSKAGRRVNIQFFAKLPDEKFFQYALDPVRQPNKAKAFEKALGYTLDNWQDLKQNVHEHYDKKKLVKKGDKGYGMLYEQLMNLKGPNGKRANVLTGWIDDSSADDGIRLTSLYVTKRKKR